MYHYVRSLSPSTKSKDGGSKKQRLRVVAMICDTKYVEHEIARARDPHFVCPETCHGFTITYLP